MLERTVTTKSASILIKAQGSVVLFWKRKNRQTKSSFFALCQICRRYCQHFFFIFCFCLMNTAFTGSVPQCTFKNNWLCCCHEAFWTIELQIFLARERTFWNLKDVAMIQKGFFYYFYWYLAETKMTLKCMHYIIFLYKSVFVLFCLHYKEWTSRMIKNQEHINVLKRTPSQLCEMFLF